MSIIPQLASSLGRRDEIPNQELAKAIVNQNNHQAVEELVDHLGHKNKDIQNDCIKVLYEIGELDPKLILPYSQTFINLLDHKNNRLQWGAMTALKTITAKDPTVVFDHLPKLVEVAEKGTVITKDNLMAILIKLCAIPRYASDSFSLFNEQLLKSAPNQLPMYAENALAIIDKKNKMIFVQSLITRLPDIEKDSKKARIEKVIKKLSK